MAQSILTLPALINNTANTSSKYFPNIDYWYGPYDSVDEAYSVLSTGHRNVLGLTVGVYFTDDLGTKYIKEYWFKTSTTLLELKAEGLTDEELEKFNLYINSKGTNVAFSSNFTSTTTGTAIGVLNIAGVNNTIYSTDVQYVTGVSDDDTNYISVGLLIIGKPEGQYSYNIRVPKPEATTVYYTDEAQGTTKIGTLYVSGKNYPVTVPTVSYEVAESVQTTAWYELIGKIHIGNGTYEVRAPKTTVDIKTTYRSGVPIATITVNETEFTIYSPKTDANGLSITSDAVSDYDSSTETYTMLSTKNREYEASIALHLSNIDSLTARISTAEENITDLDVSVMNVLDQANTLDNLINNDGDGILVTLNKHENRIESIEIDIESHIDASIENALALISTNTDNISENTIDIATNLKSIESINDTIERLNTSISANATNIVLNADNITELELTYTENINDVNNKLEEYQENYLNVFENIQTNGVIENVNGILQVQETILDMSEINASTNLYVPSVLAVFDALGGLRLRAVSESEYNNLVANAATDPRTLYFVKDDNAAL